MSSRILRISAELEREIRQEQERNKSLGVTRGITECSKEVAMYAAIGKNVLRSEEKKKLYSGRLF